MNIETFFDQATCTLTYIIYDQITKDAVIIDPVLDFDPASGSIKTNSIQKLLAFISSEQLSVHFLLETHAHADHLSASYTLHQKYFPKALIGIGENIKAVQQIFREVFNLPSSFSTEGLQFHKLFKDGETIQAGSLSFQVIGTPGHTPACVSYLFDEYLFTGDALFMPDFGTGRCDFPKGDARILFHSITRKLYLLKDETKVFVGHDYQPNGRNLQYQTTIGDSKKNNIHIKADTLEEDFVSFRAKRDATLTAPKLLFPSIQVNIDAGRLPEPESNGRSYLKTPLTF